MSDPDRLAAIKRWTRGSDPGIVQLSPYVAVSDDIDWLVGEVDRLRDLLARLEWAAGDDFGAACPECQGYRDSADGHLPDCELAAALRNANDPAPPRG